MLALLAALLVYLLHPAHPPTPQRGSAAEVSTPLREQSLPVAPAPPRVETPATAARTDDSPRSFNRRLRCTGWRSSLPRSTSPEVLTALCDRRPLAALKILLPLAEAGDVHAVAVLGIVATYSACGPHKQLTATSREILVSLARRNGAGPETLQRLDDLLAEEQAGPTADELQACRQIESAMKNLQPELVRQFTNALGRPEEALRGEPGLDVEIEFERQMLVPGDAESEQNLALQLQEKGSSESQAEAMTLLRRAARTLPSAKSQLAVCLLRGCPTPASDHTEARQLLADAAASGDYLALRVLAGSAEPGDFNPDPNLPPPERYAWNEFLRRLTREGCFGATFYSTWATSGESLVHSSNLLAMSPADAEAAQARAPALITAQLAATRRLLGCD